MNNIHIRRVYNKDNGFNHLELIQGENVLRIKIGNPLDNPQSYHWTKLKENVDKHLTQIRDEAYEV